MQDSSSYKKKLADSFYPSKSGLILRPTSRSYRAATLILICSLALVGCGGGSENTTGSTPDSALTETFTPTATTNEASIVQHGADVSAALETGQSSSQPSIAAAQESTSSAVTTEQGSTTSAVDQSAPAIANASAITVEDVFLSIKSAMKFGFQAIQRSS